MPTTPIAKLLVSRNGGAVQSGAVVCQPGDTIQLSSQSTSQRYTLFQIFGYPKGWATPAGWSLDPSSGVIYFNGLTPPSFTLPSVGTKWGKWMPLLQVEQGMTNGLLDPLRTDTSTALTMLSPGLGLKDIGNEETNQFQASWVYELQDDLRTLDSIVSVATYAEIYTVAADAALFSLLAAGTPVQLTFAHPGPALANATVSTTAIAIVAEPILGQTVFVTAEVAFVEPGTSTQIDFQIFHNGVAMPNTLRPTKYAAGELPTVKLGGTTVAYTGDTFDVRAFTVGASGTTTLSVTNGNLVVQNAGANQGPVGPAGTSASSTPYYVNLGGTGGRSATGFVVPTGNAAVIVDLSACAPNGTITVYVGAVEEQGKKTFTIDGQNADASASLLIVSSTNPGVSTVNNVLDAAQTPPQTTTTVLSGPLGTKRELTGQALSNGGAGAWATG